MLFSLTLVALSFSLLPSSTALNPLTPVDHYPWPNPSIHALETLLFEGATEGGNNFLPGLSQGCFVTRGNNGSQFDQSPVPAEWIRVVCHSVSAIVIRI
jgi:hypothetical protein